MKAYDSIKSKHLSNKRKMCSELQKRIFEGIKWGYKLLNGELC